MGIATRKKKTKKKKKKSRKSIYKKEPKHTSCLNPSSRSYRRRMMPKFNKFVRATISDLGQNETLVEKVRKCCVCSIGIDIYLPFHTVTDQSLTQKKYQQDVESFCRGTLGGGRKTNKRKLTDAERKSNSRAKRTPQEVVQDRLENAEQMRTTRAQRSPQEVVQDRLENAEQKRTTRAQRSPFDVIRDRLKAKIRMRTNRSNQSDAEASQVRLKAKETMKRLRSNRKQREMHNNCTSESTKVWDVPGVDYNHSYFESNPEVALQLWYDNNGTWRDREAKWLVGFAHAYSLLEESEQDNQDNTTDDADFPGLTFIGDADIVDLKRSLDGIIRVVIMNDCRIDEVVHTILDKEDCRKWQGDEEGVENPEMVALLYIACHCELGSIEYEMYEMTQNSKISLLNNYVTNDQENINPELADSLVGLRLQVPEDWWVERRGSTKWQSQIVGVKLDDRTKRYFTIKCKNDPHPDTYQMNFTDVVSYVDKDRYENDRVYGQEYESLRSQTYREMKEGTNRAIGVEYCQKRFEQIIECQRLTPQREHDLGQRFLQAQGRGVSWGKKEFDGRSVDAALVACACCGYRNFDEDEIYQYHDLGTDLDFLKMNDADCASHYDCIQLDEGNPLILPVNKAGKTKAFETWRIRSVWPQDRDWKIETEQYRNDHDKSEYDENLFEDNTMFGGKRMKWYHLHPEFVDEYVKDTGHVGFRAKLCGSCHDTVKKRLVWKRAGKPEDLYHPDSKERYPPRSIARGVDFGDARRIGLEALTLRERQVIAKVRHYLHIIKIESNAGKQYEHTHSALKGCGIIFDHDSPHVVKKLLNPDSINGDVEIQFVGPNGEYDRLIAKALKSANVSGRAFVIYQWLGVLQRINEWYKGDDLLPDFYDFEQTMKQCNDELVQRASRTANEAVQKQTDIARDDCANVRSTSASGSKSVVADGSSLDDEFPMRCVYVTSSEKTALNNRTDFDHEFLSTTAKTIGVDVQEQKKQYKENIMKSFRDKDPMNEYLTCDEGLVKAHPDVFLFGDAYRSKTPCLTPKQREHLLLQFTTAAASCQTLIFHQFDQMQRHETIKAVYGKTRNKENFDRFVSKFVSPHFQDKLKQAVAEPHSTAGRSVLADVSHMLSSSGKAVTFGSLERVRSKGEIMALGRRFGCASTFLTFAIDDVNNANAIRMTMRSSNNHEYPSCVSSKIHEAVKNGFNVDDVHIPIPKSYSERYSLLAGNPVGAALVYKKIVNDVLSILIGGNSSLKRTVFVSWDNDSIGISGTNLCCFGKTETTGRGSLHFHVVLWGGISPDILELVSDIPELCKRIGSVLDSMYAATLDRPCHVADLTTKELKFISNDLRVKRIVPPRAMQVSPDPLGDDTGRSYDSHYSKTVNQCGVHVHTFTCYKGTTGFRGCRLNKPSGLVDETLPVMLKEDLVRENASGESEVTYTPQKAEPLHKLRANRQTLYPFVSTDPRTIVWEVKRPKEEPLCPLGDNDVKSEVILRNLYQEMLPNNAHGYDEDVVYDPPQDENCLFRALLDGLKRVPHNVHSKTTKDLRVELMDYLREHASEPMQDPPGGVTWKRQAEIQQMERNGEENVVSTRRCFDLEQYIDEMCDDTPMTCKRGGRLEYNLFANVYSVNVAIHRHSNDAGGDIGVCVDRLYPTVHLFFVNEHYKLLRFNFHWDHFDRECSNETSSDGFVECRDIWAVSQVDLHSFAHDENNCIHNLMQGLVLVGAETSSKLSVEGLKSDLMHYMANNIDQVISSGDQELLKRDAVSVDQAIRYLKSTGILSDEYELPAVRGLDSSRSDCLCLGTERPLPLMYHDHNRIILMQGNRELVGHRLHLYLFAKSKDINVLIYEKKKNIYGRCSYKRKDVFRASKDADNAETIHLLCEDVENKTCFTLFMPKLYQVMKVLRSLNDADLLYTMYNKISSELTDRNGSVVDYNTLLTALLGCNTNALFLGAKEQSRGALFYIGPYINKNGVDLIDALPLMLKAQEDVLLRPSVAEDSGTQKRHVQHTLTRTLNMLNSQMEVSDTQAAGALLGLDARITTEAFSNYDGSGYKNYIKDEMNKKTSKMKQQLDTIPEEDDEDEDSAISDAESTAGCDNCGGGPVVGDQVTTVVNNAEVGTEGVSLEAWWDDGVDELDLDHNKGDHGAMKFYTMKDDIIHAISYPELYRHRGDALKGMNRLEYCALVKVVKKVGRSIGRGCNTAFPFGKGLKIGTEYCQILRSKQCTPQLFQKMPDHPGIKPLDPRRRRKWQMRADTFAFHYLTMFRPEVELYEAKKSYQYAYSWKALIDFETELRSSDRAINHSRLEMMDRFVQGWRVDTKKRLMLSNYRGRNRTEWSEEEQRKARLSLSKMMATRNQGDAVDYGYDEFEHKELSAGQQMKIAQTNSHKNACVSILKQCLSDNGEVEREQVQVGGVGTHNDHPIIPFDEASYSIIREAQPKNECAIQKRERCPIPHLLVRRVDDYLKIQKLSSDKNQAVSILRDHFTAMYEGRAEDRGYCAPFLMVCGGPGNGKSTLVETFDGMSSCMNVGKLVKTAFVGGAAVNIGGSSLLGLFDIPIIEKGKGETTSVLNRIKPWSDAKRKKFKLRYDLDRISCIIVDEISTVKPYVLAYLNARLMELYPESGKPFGGRAIVILGDFDQLPPVGGSSLAGAAMKYEEEQFKKVTRSSTYGTNDKAMRDFLEGNSVDTVIDIASAGILLFERVRYIKLTAQHRSKDPQHTAFLNDISSSGRISTQRLKNYKVLSEGDMTFDGEFSFATMVVTGNAERHELNAIQAKRWAARHNTKIVRWFRKRQDEKWKGKPTRAENVLMAMEEDCFYELFVPGAAGYLTENINTDIGLANGVEVKYHSLSFETSEEDERFCDEFASSDSLVMTLDGPPVAINVELYADFPGDSEAKKRENKAKRSEWTHGSLVEGRVIIQISTQWGQLIRKWAPENVDGSWQRGYSGSTVPMKDYFPVEPAFCVTIYKAQVCLLLVGIRACFHFH